MSVPPEYATLLQVFLGTGTAVFLMAAGLAIALAPPARWDRRLAGGWLLLFGFGQLNVLRYLDPAGLHIADPANPWALWLFDLAFIARAGIMAFFAVFPSPVVWRSPRGALVLLGTAQVVVGLAAWLTDKGLLWQGWPTEGYSGTALNYLIFSLGHTLVMVALLAATAFEPTARARREWPVVVLAAMAFIMPTVMELGGTLATLLVDPGALVAAALGANLDPTFRAQVRHVLFWVTEAVLAALTVQLARRGVWLPAFFVLAAVPTYLLIWQSEFGWGFFEFAFLAQGVLLAHAAHRGAFGPFALPAWASATLAVVALAAVFIAVNALALTLGGDPMTIALGVLAGTGLGVLVAGVVAGPGASWATWMAGPTPGEGSLAAYRVALQTELDAGLDGPALAAKLRPLRAELGLSDREHAVLEHALRAVRGGAAPLGPGTLLLNRYRITRLLGRGASGEVWLARDERLGREVAVKRLAGHLRQDPQALARFERETRLAAALQHPHIVAVHDVETVGDDAFLVMEYVPGGTLAERLARGPLPEAQARAMARDVLDALAALHGRGIVHRDVKPSNILLTREGRAKLGDFTVARETSGAETVGLAARGPVGTFAYMAPEQARGGPVGPASDIYAVGATMYHALAGKPPLDLEGLGELEARLRILDAAPTLPLPGVGEGTNAVLRRALVKDPAQRFESAASMARALGKRSVRAEDQQAPAHADDVAGA